MQINGMDEDEGEIKPLSDVEMSSKSSHNPCFSS